MHTIPHAPRSSLRLSALLTLLLALASLQGCSTTTRTASTPAAPPPAGTRAAPPPAGAPATAPAPTPRERSALTTERQWLQEWFRDTPVQIEQASDTISVAVPREYAFDATRSQVKPPLAAVLDKLAQSLRRLPQARLELVAAPGDAGGASLTSSGTAATPAASALAVQRAAMVRRHLISRGVPATQIGTPSAATVAAVQLRLELPAP